MKAISQRSSRFDLHAMAQPGCPDIVKGACQTLLPTLAASHRLAEDKSCKHRQIKWNYGPTGIKLQLQRDRMDNHCDRSCFHHRSIQSAIQQCVNANVLFFTEVAAFTSNFFVFFFFFNSDSVGNKRLAV